MKKPDKTLGEIEMKIVCPICGRQGSLQIRWKSARI